MAEQILNDSDLENIKENMSKLETAKEEIRRAEAAGLDMSREKAQVEEARSQLVKIRQAYFPGR